MIFSFNLHQIIVNQVISNLEINTQPRYEILGHVEYQYQFTSRYLKNERDLIIWLPPSYYKSKKRYPVLYVQDGQNLFNPSTAFNGNDWRVDETIQFLLDKKLIEEFIVVGIYNTPNRLDEYNLFTDAGKYYSLFLVNELKTFIDTNYRTKQNAGNTGIMGSSMGGLISFQNAWVLPHVFGKAACLSNSFWVNDKMIFDFVQETVVKRKNQKIYIDCGTAEKQLIRDNKRMCAMLRRMGVDKENSVYCHFEKDGKHTEIDWANRLYKPLIFLFGRKGKTK